MARNTVQEIVLLGTMELHLIQLILQSLILFGSLCDECFCRVPRANEKGVVEGMVGFSRRNFLVPPLAIEQTTASPQEPQHYS